MILDTDLTPTAFRKESQEQKRVQTEVDALNLRERRRLIVEALSSFRECQKEWDYDTDVLTLIKERGGIPFDVWMNAVLYGKDGYYSSGRCKINSGDFITVVNDAVHVSAFYFAIHDHLSQLEHPPEHPKILSVASGAGDLERNFLAIHTYAQQVMPDSALPKDMTLYSLDFSEKNLLKQRTNTRFPLEQLPPYYRVKDRDIAFYEQATAGPEAQPLFCLDMDVLTDLCKKFDCVGTIVTAEEYSRYYDQYILPYLEQKVDEKTYQFLKDDFSHIFTLAPYFSSFSGVPVTGSGFELPFGRGSLDVMITNEFHDALPSKLFVAPLNSQDSQDFRELFVTYDESANAFSFEPRPVEEKARAILDFKLQYVREKPYDIVPYSSALKTDYLVVNMASVQYLVEAARSIKSGGLLIEADYTIKGRGEEGDLHLNEQLRFRPPGSGQYASLLDQIAEYQPPWTDVTTDMNAGFLAWAGEVLGLQVAWDESQGRFTQTRSGNSADYFDDAFHCIAFVKK